MSRFTFILCAMIAAAGIATSIAIQHHANTVDRVRDLAMRAQAETLARLTADRERLQELADKMATGAELSSPQLRELMQLRDETRRLREAAYERGLLEQKNIQLKAAATKAKQRAAEAEAAPDYMPKDRIVFAGFGDPGNAMQSLLWAMINGDVSFFNNAMTPEGKAMIERQWNRKGATETQRIAQMKMMAESLVGGSTGFRISGTTMRSPDEAVMDVLFVGENSTRKFILRKIDNQWKLHTILAEGQKESPRRQAVSLP